MCCSLLMATAEMRRVARIGINFSNIIGTYFFVDTAIIVCLTVLMASGWRRFLHEVEKLELIWTRWPYNLRRDNLKLNCWILTMFWMFFATGKIFVVGHYIFSCTVFNRFLVEHCLASSVQVYIQYQESLRCNWIYSNAMKNYAHRNYAYIFNWMPYNVPVLFFVRVGFYNHKSFRIFTYSFWTNFCST